MDLPNAGAEAGLSVPFPSEICGSHGVRAGRDLSDCLLLQMNREGKKLIEGHTGRKSMAKPRGQRRCSDLSPGLTCYATLWAIERSRLLNERMNESSVRSLKLFPPFLLTSFTLAFLFSFLALLHTPQFTSVQFSCSVVSDSL